MITIINHLPCLSMDKCYNLIFTARGRRGKPSGWKKRSREQTVIFIFRNSEHFPTMSVFLSGARSVQCSYHKWSHRNMQSCTLLFRQVQNNRLKNSAFQGRSIYKFPDEKRLFVQTNVYNPSSSSFEMYQLSGSEQIYTPKTASARPHGKELKVRVISAIVCQCVSFSWYVTIPQLNAGTILAFYRLVKWEINLYWKIEERIGGGGWVWRRRGSGSLNQQPSLPCIPGHPFQPHPSPTKVNLSLWFSSSDEYSQFWFIGKKFTLQVSNTNVLI